MKKSHFKFTFKFKLFSLLFLSSIFSLNFAYSQATDTIKLMYYNALNFPGSTMETRLPHIKTIVQYAHPEIMVLNEMQEEYACDSIINTINSGSLKKYSRAEFVDGPDSDNILIFDNSVFKLISQTEIPTALRNISHYKLCYFPYSIKDSVFVNVFSAHLKASDGTDNEKLRLAEVQLFTSYLQTLPKIENVFFGGDLNFYEEEAAYVELTTNSTAPLIDVVGGGAWHDNSIFSSQHTQSTRSTMFGGGATGGLDDRFDFMVFSNDMILNQNFIQYISNSYKPLGNDGLHLNKSIIYNTNTSVPADILNALYNFSDHLPIVAEYIVTAPNNLGTSTISKKNRFSYFTNQQNHEIVVKIENPQKFDKIELYDLSGKLILEKSNLQNSETIQLNSFQKGMYILRFKSTNETSSFKIVKM